MSFEDADALGLGAAGTTAEDEGAALTGAELAGAGSLVFGNRGMAGASIGAREDSAKGASAEGEAPGNVVTC
jgi:hypothetical protein